MPILLHLCIIHHVRDRIDARPQRRVHKMRIALGRLHLRMTQQLADHFQGRTTADQQ